MPHTYQPSQYISSEPLITVITAVKNDYAGLKLTVLSIKDNLPQAEHLIIDGSDNFQDITSLNVNIIQIASRDSSISHAFNRGVLRSHGYYVLFLNAGDTLIDGTYDQIYEYLATKQYDCHFFPVIRTSRECHTKLIPRPERLCYYMSCPHQGIIISRDVFSTIGLFPIQKYSMDHYIMAAFMHSNAYQYLIHDEPISYYPVGGHSTKGGIMPFLYNIKNTINVSPSHLPASFFINVLLSIKVLLLQKNQ